MAINIGVLGIFQKHTEKLAIQTKLELIRTIFDRVMAISNFRKIPNAILVHLLAYSQKTSSMSKIDRNGKTKKNCEQNDKRNQKTSGRKL